MIMGKLNIKWWNIFFDSKKSKKNVWKS